MGLLGDRDDDASHSKVESDASRYFEPDLVAVRAALRADWKVLDPTRVVRLDASSG